MTRRLIPTAVAAALVAAALAAPAALARPDASASVAKPAVTTGYRHAIAGHGGSRFAARPVLDRPSSPGGAAVAPVASRPVTVSVTRPDRGIDWTTIAIGIAGSLLAVGLLAGIAGRTRRTHRPHIAA
jgi:hypothetical protein